jgi:hypothetical protein
MNAADRRIHLPLSQINNNSTAFARLDVWDVIPH